MNADSTLVTVMLRHLVPDTVQVRLQVGDVLGAHGDVLVRVAICPKWLGVRVLGELVQLLSMRQINDLVFGSVHNEGGRLDLLDEKEVWKHVQRGGPPLQVGFQDPHA